MVREADVVLALDVSNFLSALGDTDRSTREVRLLNEAARVIAISLDDYAFRSWAHTFQSLAPVDLPIAADAALVLPALVDGGRGSARRRRSRAASGRRERSASRARHAALRAEWQATVSLERATRRCRPPCSPRACGRSSRTKTGCWPTAPPRAGRAGSGTGSPSGATAAAAAPASATACRPRSASRSPIAARGKVCVNLQADGDLLYVVSGLYTAAHHRLPLLTVMFNNRTYGNDEEHQETVAKTRGRPVENKVVGIRIDDPAPDFARIAQGFGVHAEGPIDTADAVGPALRRALRVVKDEGRPGPGRRDHTVLKEAPMARAGYRIFDADTHVIEPVEPIEAYLSSADRAKLEALGPAIGRAPAKGGKTRYQIGKRPRLDRLLGSRERVAPPASTARGGTPWDVRWQGPPFPSDRVSFDPHARVADMDIEGVDVNMILPSGGVPSFCGLDGRRARAGDVPGVSPLSRRLLRALSRSPDEPAAGLRRATRRRRSPRCVAGRKRRGPWASFRSARPSCRSTTRRGSRSGPPRRITI